jgi:tetratricopeptide (TPR) repeat protein
LRAWDSTRVLGEQPLAGLRVVTAQRLSAGYSETVAGYGLALRETLQSAIQALRPESGDFNPAEKRWRPYFILNEQYIHDRPPEWVSAQLCISRRTYYNEQEEALEAIADLLRQREELAGTLSPVTSREAGGETGRKIPFLAPPRSVQPLVGREDVLNSLKTRLLDGAGRTPLAVFGLPGVGKSSLAIELAHAPEILAHFSDGVLWVGLGRQPDLPALLNSWAVALGLPTEAVKFSDLAATARALHAAVGTRRMLLIIDDAWEIEQVLVFKLGGPHCSTLLTTRLGTVATDFAGGEVLHLRELDTTQGLGLLAQAASQAIVTDLDIARSLVTAVGGLPLALVLMGRHLRKVGQNAQSRRLKEAVEQLQQAETRLQLVQPQSPFEQRSGLSANASISLQTIIGISAAALSPKAQQALQALALFPPKPNTFSEAAALAVSGATLVELDALTDSGLVECHPPDRQTLHQTISDYARAQGTDVLACQRYVAFFIQLVAGKSLSYKALDPELDNLLAALDLADHGCQNAEFAKLCQALHPFLMSRGLFQLDEQLLLRATELAHRLGDVSILANTLSSLGLVKLRLGKYPEAQGDLKEALEMARQLGDGSIEANCLQGLGNILYYMAEYKLAEDHLGRALALFQKLGDQGGEVRALNSLGLVNYEQGLYPEATADLEQALRINRLTGNRENEGLTLSNLGLVLADQGNYSQAVGFHQQALKISREYGNVRLEGAILDNLSYALTQLGQLSEAKGCYERALQIFRQIGNQQGMASVLSFLAALLQTLGDAPAALEDCQQSLELANDLKERYTQGVALTVMGHALTDLERPLEAAEAYRQAVQLWQENNQFHLALDALAGLARLAQQRGNPQNACQYVDQILAHLENQTLDGVLDPCWIYLTCYQVLQACGDARAGGILSQAHARLMEQAASIETDDLRHSFLERVATHREILELYGTAHGEIVSQARAGRRRRSA